MSQPGEPDSPSSSIVSPASKESSSSSSARKEAVALRSVGAGVSAYCMGSVARAQRSAHVLVRQPPRSGVSDFKYTK
eukprot:scaffold21950_cov59-Phaeocystis_antarctica.AAC.2